jgi:hypothetical protein
LHSPPPPKNNNILISKKDIIKKRKAQSSTHGVHMYFIKKKKKVHMEYILKKKGWGEIIRGKLRWDQRHQIFNICGYPRKMTDSNIANYPHLKTIYKIDPHFNVNSFIWTPPTNKVLRLSILKAGVYL